MLKVIMTKGLPGSGKTTWAKHLIDTNPNMYKRVNKDDLRAMLDNGKHSDDSEKFVLNIRDYIVHAALQRGKHVIVDDTNLAPKHETRIKELVNIFGKDKAQFIVQDFTDVALTTCIEQDRKRQNPVGKKVIMDMYNQFLKPEPKVMPKFPNIPFAIICDLDGTLAHMNGRSPYDASTCDNDLLNPVVASLLNGKRVILVSGREDKYKPQTEVFLKKHNITYEKLLMRPTGDNRKDWIVKQEIFDNEIYGQYNIDYVLDDRSQVVRMWRDLGLTCLQVADGDF